MFLIAAGEILLISIIVVIVVFTPCCQKLTGGSANKAASTLQPTASTASIKRTGRKAPNQLVTNPIANSKRFQ